MLAREDHHVPRTTADGAIGDETRIRAALATLGTLRKAGARLVVCSHLGRPKGAPDPKYSLRPVATRLGELLEVPVGFVTDCVGESVRNACTNLRDGEVLLLENLRFHPGEEKNDPAFVRELAANAELYVNDAFGAAHRAHASTEGVAHVLPAAAGLLMEAELAALSKLVDDPERPFVCVIGGAKVADKIGVFTNLIGKVDEFCIGGGMANTFLAAQGIDVGKSLRDADLVPAKQILAQAEQKGVHFHLPTDGIVAESLDDAAERAEMVIGEPLGDRMILDIGVGTAGSYAQVIRRALTVVFNGPMGVYEKPRYRGGTEVVGRALADVTAMGGTTVVGGGDAAAAAQMLGFASAVTHVSTGGGATLEFLEGKTLPGVAALESAAAQAQAT